ncbi:protein-disulfide isomerase [Bradyrhizobium sp. USDA 4341]
MSVLRVLGGVFLAAVTVSAAFGQTAAPSEKTSVETTSEVTNPLANRAQLAPVLRFMQAKGVKLTALGAEGGLSAYLGESPNSQTQIFYVTPDGTHVVAGVLFDVEGNNITGVQIGEMQRRFEAAQKQLGKAPFTAGAPQTQSKQSADEASAPKSSAALAADAKVDAKVAPSATGSSPLQLPVDEATAPVKGTDAKSSKAAADPQEAAPKVPAAKPEQQSAAEPAKFEPAVLTASAEKYVSGLDRGAVERALNEAAWFRVGVEEAPAIYMVADPQCPFCHAAWGRLKDMVWAHKLQIRIIMIAGLKGSLPKAISILSRPQPGTAWFAGEGSTDGIDVQPPPAEGSAEYIAAQKALTKNVVFVRQFGLTRTPTLVYIGKDNRLYSSEGLPEDAGSFLAALN